MAAQNILNTLIALLLLCLSQLCHSLPQSPTTSADSSTITDPGGVGPNQDPEPTTAAGMNAAGAVGSSSSFNLSTGSIIAIVVVTSVVVLLGAASATLFFLAKKRQWKIAESMRRSLRRVTSTLSLNRPKTPKTPQKMGFEVIPRSPKKEGDKEPKREREQEQDRSVVTKPESGHGRSRSQKGIATIDTAIDHKGRPVSKNVAVMKPQDTKGGEKDLEKNQNREEGKRPPLVSNKSAFDMDSPVNKGGIWSMILGRK